MSTPYDPMQEQCGDTLVTEGYWQIKMPLGGKTLLARVWYHSGPDALVYCIVGTACYLAPRVREAPFGTQWRRAVKYEEMVERVKAVNQELDAYKVEMESELWQ